VRETKLKRQCLARAGHVPDRCHTSATQVPHKCHTGARHMPDIPPFSPPLLTPTHLPPLYVYTAQPLFPTRSEKKSPPDFGHFILHHTNRRLPPLPRTRVYPDPWLSGSNTHASRLKRHAGQQKNRKRSWTSRAPIGKPSSVGTVWVNSSTPYHCLPP